MSTRQRARADVQPTTWEIPVAGAGVWLVAAALILPTAQGVAATLFGGGWVWPRGGTSALVASIRGLAVGKPGRGIPTELITRVPSGASIYVLIVVAELVLVAVSVWVFVLWWSHLGPGAWHGMAGRLEVESVLGVSGLRKARKVIRPDLYGTDGGAAS